MDLQRVKVDLEPHWLGFNHITCGKSVLIGERQQRRVMQQTNVCCEENVQLKYCWHEARITE